MNQINVVTIGKLIEAHRDGDEHCAFDSKPIKHTQWVRFLGKD